MKLTEYIKDLGRVVAYYPKLKNVTGSTTSSILLCQLLYWSDKTKDGWIWKTSDEIEEETGLTYNEQRTARKELLELGLIKEENRRLEHMIRFRVEQDALNTAWEEQGGSKLKRIPRKDEKVEPDLDAPAPQIASTLFNVDPITGKRTIKKQGDMVDGFIAAQNYPGNIKAKEMMLIKEKVEHKLNIIANNPKWERFIEFAWKQEKINQKSVDTFLTWALKEGFDPLYWTPEKMETMYPQAFIRTMAQQEENFVKPMPEVKEITRVPMPKEAKINRADTTE